jgi:hypothetical protein
MCAASGFHSQRIQQVGRLVRSGLGEPMIPVIEHRSQCVASGRQLPDLFVERIENPRGGGADVMARRTAGLTFLEKGGELVERKSHTDRVTDQRHALDHGWREEAISRGSARRPRQQAETVIVPNGVGADTGALGELSDSEEVTRR